MINEMEDCTTEETERQNAPRMLFTFLICHTPLIRMAWTDAKCRLHGQFVKLPCKEDIVIFGAAYAYVICPFFTHSTVKLITLL